MALKKSLQRVAVKALDGNTYKKFTEPKVSRGKTAFPSGAQKQKQVGIRYDYDGVITKDGVEYHKFNIQPNAGDDIDSSFKRWRQDNGGTHSVMSVLFVKKDGTKEDFEKALEEAHKAVEG